MLFKNANELGVVPSNWIKNGLCAWPPQKDKKGYARKRVPPCINWVKYDVKQYESYGMLTLFYYVSLLLTLVPFCHSDTYEEPDLHLQDHFMSSDLEAMESESLAKSNNFCALVHKSSLKLGIAVLPTLSASRWILPQSILYPYERI